MREITIGEIKLPYKIDWRKTRSSVGFGIGQDMKLIVRAPRSSTIQEIEDVIEKKKAWLLEKTKRIQEQKGAPLKKEFLSGEKLPYKGRRYRLKVLYKNNLGEPRLEFQQGKFLLFIEENEQEKLRKKKARFIVENWYKEKAGANLPKRARQHARKMNLEPVNIETKDLNKKWGRIKQDSIEFHWRLIIAPLRIQDYIIVHELAHLKEPIHTKSFWNTVGALIPDYEDRIEWLRINGGTLNF